MVKLHKKSLKGGDINLDHEEKENLKESDTWHDFGHVSSNRNAVEGLRMLGQTKPPAFGDLVFKASLGNRKLRGKPATGYANTKCIGNAAMRSVIYERQVTAALDSCEMENAWNQKTSDLESRKNLYSNGPNHNETGLAKTADTATKVSWSQIANKDPAFWDTANTKWREIDSDILIIGDGDHSDLMTYYTFSEGSGEKQRARNIIGGFIVNYLFPNYHGNETVEITYDAGGGKAVKMFNGMNQVKALVMPQNVSDSASTSLDPFAKYSTLSHARTDFYFPTGEGGSPTAPLLDGSTPKYKFTSQFFSADYFEIFILDEGFNSNKTYGFKIRVMVKGVPTVFFDFTYNFGGYLDLEELSRLATQGQQGPVPLIRFGGQGSGQGPSAPYLSKLIDAIVQAPDTVGSPPPNISNITPETTNLPLNGFIEWFFGPKMTVPGNKKRLIAGILFDLKRSGDYEQANAALNASKAKSSSYVILATGDILCSTYARSIKMPCILQGVGSGSGGGGGNNAMILFRAPVGDIKNLPSNFPQIKTLLDEFEYIKFNLDNDRTKIKQYLDVANVFYNYLRVQVKKFEYDNPTDEPFLDDLVPLFNNLVTTKLRTIGVTTFTTPLSPQGQNLYNIPRNFFLLYQNIDNYIQIVQAIIEYWELEASEEVLERYTDASADNLMKDAIQRGNMQGTGNPTINGMSMSELSTLMVTFKDLENNTNDIFKSIQNQMKKMSKKGVTSNMLVTYINTLTTTESFPMYKNKPPSPPGIDFDTKVTFIYILKDLGFHISTFYKVFDNFSKFIKRIPKKYGGLINKDYLTKYKETEFYIGGSKFFDLFPENYKKAVFAVERRFSPIDGKLYTEEQMINYWTGVCGNAKTATVSPDAKRIFGTLHEKLQQLNSQQLQQLQQQQRQRLQWLKPFVNQVITTNGSNFPVGLGMFLGKVVWDCSTLETFSDANPPFYIKDTISSFIPQLEVAYDLVLEYQMVEIKKTGGRVPRDITVPARNAIKDIDASVDFHLSPFPISINLAAIPGNFIQNLTANTTTLLAATSEFLAGGGITQKNYKNPRRGGKKQVRKPQIGGFSDITNINLNEHSTLILEILSSMGNECVNFITSNLYNIYLTYKYPQIQKRKIFTLVQSLYSILYNLYSSMSSFMYGTTSFYNIKTAKTEDYPISLNTIGSELVDIQRECTSFLTEINGQLENFLSAIELGPSSQEGRFIIGIFKWIMAPNAMKNFSSCFREASGQGSVNVCGSVRRSPRNVTPVHVEVNNIITGLEELFIKKNALEDLRQVLNFILTKSLTGQGEHRSLLVNYLELIHLVNANGIDVNATDENGDHPEVFTTAINAFKNNLKIFWTDQLIEVFQLTSNDFESVANHGTLIELKGGGASTARVHGVNFINSVTQKLIANDFNIVFFARFYNIMQLNTNRFIPQLGLSSQGQQDMASKIINISAQSSQQQYVSELGNMMLAVMDNTMNGVIGPAQSIEPQLAYAYNNIYGRVIIVHKQEFPGNRNVLLADEIDSKNSKNSEDDDDDDDMGNMGGGGRRKRMRKKKTRKRKKRKYKTLRRRKKNRKRSLKRKKRKKKTKIRK